MGSRGDSRPRVRGPAIAALASVAILGGAAPQAAPRAATAALSGEPHIVFLWGQASRVTSTAAGDLYVVRGDGTGLHRLRSWRDSGRDGQVYGATQAEWSPGGKQLDLMLGYWCGDPCRRLARLSADGSRLKTVSVRADILRASWSPDGRAVLTTFNRDELWTVPMGGGKPTRIWHSRTARADDAAWAPDGRHLAVTTGRGITRMTAAGKDRRRLTQSGRDANPQWSPDGLALAFIRGEHLWIVGKDGRGLRRLASTAHAWNFLWSPDGRSILFTRQRTSGDDVTFDIALVRRNGSGLRRLTLGPSDYAMSWSPDGRKILFTREAAREQGGGDQLWSMNADGSGQTQLPVYRPRWSIFSVDWGP